MSEHDDNTMVRNLDMSNGPDRALIGKAAKRWDVDDELKSQAIRALRVALAIALRKESARDIRSIVATIKDIEGQNQSDEHLDIKHQRLDEGKATDAVEHYVVQMPKPRALIEGDRD